MSASLNLPPPVCLCVVTMDQQGMTVSGPDLKEEQFRTGRSRVINKVGEGITEGPR
jgi:hypothetical protein